MERITFNEMHQQSMTELNDLITDLTKEGLTFKEQSLAVISGCLMEMNGYLAAIAESLRNEEGE